MYKIRRHSGHVTEQLQIEDAGKELTLNVDIYVDAIIRDYVELGSRLNALRQRLQSGDKTEELIVEYGKVVTSYFALFFGEDQTVQLLEWYDHRYNEMLLDITPFLQDVVVPAIIAAQTDMKQKYVALAKRGRR